MIRFVAIFIAAIALAACQPEGGTLDAPQTATQGGGDSPLLLEQQCEAAGGKIVYGLAGPQCAEPQPDGGKSCSDSAQCEGFCMAKTRTCSKVKPNLGCHSILQGGKTVALCVD